MEQQFAAERVLRKLRNYAEARNNVVGRGLETAELAGLIVQKYGYGLCDAFWEIYEGGSGPTYQDVDLAVSSIDAKWKETQAANGNLKQI